eukprot:SAG31_NODE_4488_length_3193_cov_5.386555_1_plen_115_part_00
MVVLVRAAGMGERRYFLQIHVNIHICVCQAAESPPPMHIGTDKRPIGKMASHPVGFAAESLPRRRAGVAGSSATMSPGCFWAEIGYPARCRPILLYGLLLVECRFWYVDSMLQS